VLKENLSNIIKYIITIITFMEILQLLFSDEFSLNEVMLFNVPVNSIKDYTYSATSVTVKATYTSKIPSVLR